MAQAIATTHDRLQNGGLGLCNQEIMRVDCHFLPIEKKGHKDVATSCKSSNKLVHHIYENRDSMIFREGCNENVVIDSMSTQWIPSNDNNYPICSVSTKIETRRKRATLTARSHSFSPQRTSSTICPTPKRRRLSCRRILDCQMCDCLSGQKLPGVLVTTEDEVNKGRRTPSFLPDYTFDRPSALHQENVSADVRTPVATMESNECFEQRGNATPQRLATNVLRGISLLDKRVTGKKTNFAPSGKIDGEARPLVREDENRPIPGSHGMEEELNLLFLPNAYEALVSNSILIPLL